MSYMQSMSYVGVFQANKPVEVDGELATILTSTRFKEDFTCQPLGGPSAPCGVKPQVSVPTKFQDVEMSFCLMCVWALEVSMFVLSVSRVWHAQRAPLSNCTHSRTHTCTPGRMLQVLPHALTYPLKHTYAHVHTHKVKQLSWSHNQTVESCWGTLNRKECSLLS